ncbi:MAG: alpha-ketoacid dehydrogenase subunit beta [Candidatus Wildermuthbacteria bacterium]|nr:alpha-ketoacid dehydrogenase subunit beta [Candidatus Wildermuthbacteria bacterium]
MPSRKLSYSLAINEALHQMMKSDDSVFLVGQGVKSPWYVGNTCGGLLEAFGERRVIDTPVSENSMTGAAVGAAIAGMRPVVVHPRMDFMMYAMDPIVNEAANWSYMFGGRSSCPVVIWGIINRGGEQGAQHSQALQALFAHIPGLKVVMPSTPYDAKGLMISAIKDNGPVVFIDDRWLYGQEEDVPEKMYEVPLGKGIVRRKGKDATVVGISYMAAESLKAAKELEKDGIDAEVIDVRTVKPLDIPLVLESVKKTGRIVIAEAAWMEGSVAGEIAAQIADVAFRFLKAPIKRVSLPDSPAPTSSSLEKAFYINAADVVAAVKKLLA